MSEHIDKNAICIWFTLNRETEMAECRIGVVAERDAGAGFVFGTIVIDAALDPNDRKIWIDAMGELFERSLKKAMPETSFSRKDGNAIVPKAGNA